jgi:hypothetical protein
MPSHGPEATGPALELGAPLRGSVAIAADGRIRDKEAHDAQEDDERGEREPEHAGEAIPRMSQLSV